MFSSLEQGHTTQTTHRQQGALLVAEGTLGLTVSFIFQMVNLLLAKGANINAFDKKDRRALHWAAYMGEESVLKNKVQGSLLPQW